MAYDNSIANDWKALKKPMLYTPGDNEWSDCHKSGEGGGTWNTAAGAIDYVLDSTGAKPPTRAAIRCEPALVRTIFFSQPGKDFTGLMGVHSQAQEFDSGFPGDAAFVENVVREVRRVVRRDQRARRLEQTTTTSGTAPHVGRASPASITGRRAARRRWLASTLPATA